MKRKQDSIATIILTGFLFSFGFGHSAAFGKPPIPQNQLISVGILSFQDESGSNAPSESGQKIAQELQQKLVVGYKDLLPRLISAGDPAEIKALTVDQLVALGKQHGVKFVVRGGLLAVTSESAGAETKINIQLYAEIASAETGSTSSVRAEGNGTQKSAVADTTTQLGSIDFRRADFRASALGQALATAIEQLAASIHQAVTTPQIATADGSPQTGTETSQAATTDAQATQAAEADAELQQLIAQAETLLTSNSSSSTESLGALSQALEGVKTALAAKTSLMEQSQDTTQADQQIAVHQQELQAALTKAMEEAATTGTTTGEAEQPTGEKKGFMAQIDEFAGQSLGLLQKIQEMRAALRGFKEEPSAYPTGEAGDPGTEGAMPSEGSVEEVSGVITEDGSPVEGAIVTDEESGLSTMTDSSGAYALKGLLSGKLAKLTISKGLKKMTTQVEVFARRANVADLQFNPASTGSVRPLMTVLPSTVVINAIRSAGAGQVRGVVRDALGNPVARALVTLRVLGTARTSSPGQHVLPNVFASAHHVNMGRTKLTHIRPETQFGQMRLTQTSKNLGVARTNSLGQYAFLNVPAGAYQLTINHSGLRLKTAQVQVGQRKIAEANFKFSQSDAIARLPMAGRSLILPGAATVLRGTVLDDQNRPVAGAKVSAVQSESVISVFTGMKGTFELRNLKPGAYRITIFKVGYIGATQQLALRPGGAEERKFQIKQQSSPLIAGLLRTETKRRSETQRNERQGETSGDTRIPRKEITYGSDTKLPGGGLTLVKKGQLAGNITDAANGKPLSAVSVSLPGQPSTKTDQQGNYRFAPLAPGNYQVSAKLNGYAPETRTIVIRSGSSARQDLALRSERHAPPNVIGEIRKPPVIIGGLGVRVGQVTGQVIDSKTGKPISGASISVTGQRSIATNAEGRFAFANLAPGTYQVSAGKIGFSSGQMTVAIRAGQTATANFKLDPRSVPPVRLRLP